MGTTHIARIALIVGLAAGSAHAEQRGDLIERDDEPLLFPEPAARRRSARALPAATTAALGAGIAGGAAVVVGAGAIAVHALSGSEPRSMIVVPVLAAAAGVLAAPIVATALVGANEPGQSGTIFGTTFGAALIGAVVGGGAGSALYLVDHTAAARALGFKEGDGGWGMVMCAGLGASVGVLATTTTTAAITTTLLGVE